MYTSIMDLANQQWDNNYCLINGTVDDPSFTHSSQHSICPLTAAESSQSLSESISTGRLCKWMASSNEWKAPVRSAYVYATAMPWHVS